MFIQRKNIHFLKYNLIFKRKILNSSKLGILPSALGDLGRRQNIVCFFCDSCNSAVPTDFAWSLFRQYDLEAVHIQ